MTELKKDKKKKNIKEKIKNKVDKFDKKDYFSTFEVVIIVLIAILFGFIIGNVISFTKDRTITAKIPAELEEFIDTYNNIVDNYYEKKINKKELVDSGIKGLIDYLDDPFSLYMNEETAEDFNETVNGYYIGIGASISITDGKVIVVSMYDNSPASNAGIKEKDQIIKIAGKNVENKSLSEISKIIKGKKGSKLKVTVLRDGEEKELTIIRGKVEIPSVSSEIIENNNKIGYIKIDTFAANTYKQFKKELKNIENKKIDYLIIDVRNNLGGHLSQVSKIMSMFLEKDKVIYKLEEKKKKTTFKDKTSEHREYPVIVLSNNASASASELLIAAFKESYPKATIIGTKTYGKGTVQKAYELSSGASIKYTTEKWLTPKGHWINEKGITPNIKVEESNEYKENATRENDNQLQAALNYIEKGAEWK